MEGATSAKELGNSLSLNDAMAYINLVKKTFSHQPDVYNHFLGIMSQFKKNQIDTVDALDLIGVLFQRKPSLIQKFNVFLPAGYHVGCSTVLTVASPRGTKIVDMTRSVEESWSQSVPPAPTAPPASPEQEELQRLRTLLSQEMNKNNTLETKIRDLSASAEVQAEYTRKVEEKHQSSEMRAEELDRKVKEIENRAEANIAESVKLVKGLKESLANLKSERSTLSRRVRELEDIDTTIMQRSVIEHANIHILIHLLSVAKDDFALSRITQDQMLQACDNLGEQLKEIASRQLERVPVGFSTIDKMMRSRARRTREEVKEEEDDDINERPSKRLRV